MERTPDNLAGQTDPAAPTREMPAQDAVTELDTPATPRHKHRLGMKNLLAAAAALMFVISVFADDNHLLFKAIAYGLGMLAYLGELLVLTHGFRRHVALDEMFMPLLFGCVYLLLGLSYALEHHFLG